MNTMRQFCAASLLTLTLTLSASAGNMHFGVTQPPPPPPGEPATIEESNTTTDGTMHFPEATDSTLEAALSLLRVVLSII